MSSLFLYLILIVGWLEVYGKLLIEDCSFYDTITHPGTGGYFGKLYLRRMYNETIQIKFDKSINSFLTPLTTNIERENNTVTFNMTVTLPKAKNIFPLYYEVRYTKNERSPIINSVKLNDKMFCDDVKTNSTNNRLSNQLFRNMKNTKGKKNLPKRKRKKKRIKHVRQNYIFKRKMKKKRAKKAKPMESIKSVRNIWKKYLERNKKRHKKKKKKRKIHRSYLTEVKNKRKQNTNLDDNERRNKKVEGGDRLTNITCSMSDRKSGKCIKNGRSNNRNKKDMQTMKNFDELSSFDKESEKKRIFTIAPRRTVMLGVNGIIENPSLDEKMIQTKNDNRPKTQKNVMIKIVPTKKPNEKSKVTRKVPNQGTIPNHQSKRYKTSPTKQNLPLRKKKEQNGDAALVSNDKNKDRINKVQTLLSKGDEKTEKVVKKSGNIEAIPKKKDILFEEPSKRSKMANGSRPRISKKQDSLDQKFNSQTTAKPRPFTKILFMKNLREVSKPRQKRKEVSVKPTYPTTLRQRKIKKINISKNKAEKPSTNKARKKKTNNSKKSKMSNGKGKHTDDLLTEPRVVNKRKSFSHVIAERPNLKDTRLETKNRLQERPIKGPLKPRIPAKNNKSFKKKVTEIPSGLKIVPDGTFRNEENSTHDNTAAEKKDKSMQDSPIDLGESQSKKNALKESNKNAKNDVSVDVTPIKSQPSSESYRNVTSDSQKKEGVIRSESIVKKTWENLLTGAKKVKVIEQKGTKSKIKKRPKQKMYIRRRWSKKQKNSHKRYSNGKKSKRYNPDKKRKVSYETKRAKSRIRRRSSNKRSSSTRKRQEIFRRRSQFSRYRKSRKSRESNIRSKYRGKTKPDYRHKQGKRPKGGPRRRRRATSMSTQRRPSHKRKRTHNRLSKKRTKSSKDNEFNGRYPKGRLPVRYRRQLAKWRQRKNPSKRKGRRREKKNKKRKGRRREKKNKKRKVKSRKRKIHKKPSLKKNSRKRMKRKTYLRKKTRRRNKKPKKSNTNTNTLRPKQDSNEKKIKKKTNPFKIQPNKNQPTTATILQQLEMNTNPTFALGDINDDQLQVAYTKPITKPNNRQTTKRKKGFIKNVNNRHHINNAHTALVTRLLLHIKDGKLAVPIEQQRGGYESVTEPIQTQPTPATMTYSSLSETPTLYTGTGTFTYQTYTGTGAYTGTGYRTVILDNNNVMLVPHGHKIVRVPNYEREYRQEYEEGPNRNVMTNYVIRKGQTTDTYETTTETVTGTDPPVTKPPPTTQPLTLPKKPPCRTKYDYHELIRKSLLFYEAQRSGKLPKRKRIYWRSHSGLLDGRKEQVDLVGGYYDGGHHMKYNFPMAATTTLLAWGMIESIDVFRRSDEYLHGLYTIKWATDYFIKCSKGDTFWAQVGEPRADRATWSRPEDMSYSNRPAFKLSPSKPGSDLIAEVSASLAASSILFKPVNTKYSSILIKLSKKLFNLANKYKGKYHKNFPNKVGIYKSSGYFDELAWAAAWIYKATNKKFFLDKAENIMATHPRLMKKASDFSWDNKTLGLQLLMIKLTNNEKYIKPVKQFFDWVQSNDVPKTPQGMIFLKRDGATRYAANLAFAGLIASKYRPNLNYIKLARKQIHLLVGDAGRSFVVGFGNNPPKRPYHAASTCMIKSTTTLSVSLHKCSWRDYKKKYPNPNVLYGALVGGPNLKGQYIDERTNRLSNRVALDFNAGFQSAVAILADLQHRGYC